MSIRKIIDWAIEDARGQQVGNIASPFYQYYDSAGQAVRDYLKEPGELGPMATVEYVVSTTSTSPFSPSGTSNFTLS